MITAYVLIRVVDADSDPEPNVSTAIAFTERQAAEALRDLGAFATGDCPWDVAEESSEAGEWYYVETHEMEPTK